MIFQKCTIYNFIILVEILFVHFFILNTFVLSFLPSLLFFTWHIFTLPKLLDNQFHHVQANERSSAVLFPHNSQPKATVQNGNKIQNQVRRVSFNFSWRSFWAKRSLFRRFHFYVPPSSTLSPKKTFSPSHSSLYPTPSARCYRSVSYPAPFEFQPEWVVCAKTKIVIKTHNSLNITSNTSSIDRGFVQISTLVAVSAEKAVLNGDVHEALHIQRSNQNNSRKHCVSNCTC